MLKVLDGQAVQASIQLFGGEMKALMPAVRKEIAAVEAKSFGTEMLKRGTKGEVAGLIAARQVVIAYGLYQFGYSICL